MVTVVADVTFPTIATAGFAPFVNVTIELFEVNVVVDVTSTGCPPVTVAIAV